MYKVEELYEKLLELELFTEDELQLVTCINGFSIETLSDCLYCRYGYDAEQFLEELEGDDNDDEDDEDDEEEEEEWEQFLDQMLELGIFTEEELQLLDQMLEEEAE